MPKKIRRSNNRLRKTNRKVRKTAIRKRLKKLVGGADSEKTDKFISFINGFSSISELSDYLTREKEQREMRELTEMISQLEAEDSGVEAAEQAFNKAKRNEAMAKAKRNKAKAKADALAAAAKIEEEARHSSKAQWVAKAEHDIAKNKEEAERRTLVIEMKRRQERAHAAAERARKEGLRLDGFDNRRGSESAQHNAWMNSR